MKLLELRRYFRRPGGGLMGALLLLGSLGGCGMGDALGVSKNPPDEFAVVTKAPLVVPPQYHLRPPEPGTPRPQEQTAEALAVSALFPGQEKVPAPSAGQQALLRDAGADGADSAVRTSVNDPNVAFVAKGKLTAEILNAETMQSESASLERVTTASAE